jgi:hypothetical protein
MAAMAFVELVPGEWVQTLYSCIFRSCSRLKPVTYEQVFYDKFLCDKFYLPSARVYMQQILYDRFSCDRVLFTGVNVSEKGVYRRHDRKIIIVR